VSDTYTWDKRQSLWARHDGKRLRQAIISADLPALRDPAPIDSHADATPVRRARALDQAIEECLMAGGTVLQKGQFSAIIGQKKPMQHAWHILLSVVTLGLWLTPYLIMAVVRKDMRYRIEVDQWGHVWPTVAP